MRKTGKASNNIIKIVYILLAIIWVAVSLLFFLVGSNLGSVGKVIYFLPTVVMLIVIVVGIIHLSKDNYKTRDAVVLAVLPWIFIVVEFAVSVSQDASRASIEVFMGSFFQGVITGIVGILIFIVKYTKQDIQENEKLIGAPVLSDIIREVFGISAQYDFTVKIIVLIIWVLIFGTSVYLGLDKGIQRLSNINVVLAFIFMGLILLIGPTMQIFKMEVNSIGLYASDFIKMSTYTDPFGEGKFSSEWTVFYWGWWIAFMPMMGMFVGKISRGRTIKNVMWGQLLWGTLGCCCSFMIFGGYSLYLQQSGKVDLATILAEEGNSGAIIAILQTLPMSKIMMLFLCIVCFVYLATTIDSCAYVLAGTTTKRLSYKEDPARWNRILWAVLFCVLSIGLMIIGGLEAVKTISVLTGLPLIAVLIVLMVSVKRMLKEDEEKEEKRK